MKYLCGKCIHFDVCYVPRSIGCVEICGHYKAEPKEPMTEQEYIQSCNHKELTEILFRMIVHGSVIRPDRQYISEWLKQPHRGDGE